MSGHPLVGSKAVVLELEGVPALPRRLVRTQTLGPRPGVSAGAGLRQGLGICISNKLSGTENTARPGRTLWEALYQGVF